ncbi:MAG TPA: LacI family transcriptional regulator [Anaerolineae bacterium]|nr:LacI family transcriptional regulator [Anaerolineae bacterium]
MKNRVSIKDIAQLAGVSHSTVSRALQGTGRMSEETRERILTIAEELGYTPDALAQSLVRGRTKTVGVVVTTIADPFVAGIIDGIEQVAGDAGYTVILGASHMDPEREMAVVENLRQRRVDAVIVTASRVGSHYTEHLQRFGVPIVLVNNMVEGEYLYAIACDQREGARCATRHLLELGHKRIAYVGSPFREHSSQERQQGYEDALHEAGVTPDPSLISTPPLTQDVAVGRRAFQELWPQRPTAIFAYNDLTAIGIMLAAREMRVRIPQDISLVGFDDIEVTEYVTPPLTTVHQPRQAMGRAAMEMALGLLHDERVQNQRLACRLVVRASTQAPPA